jgi:PAS domain S-box-containing protein
MDASPAPGLLSDLARICAGADDPDELLAEALPVVLELSGARAVLVVRRTADGHVVAARAGVVLDSVGAADALLIEERDRLTDLAVPQRWVSSAVARAAARRLPGHTGVMALAWGPEGQSSATSLEVALAMVDGALARLQAEERLSDLIVRVNSAQQLAGMGDYDWHIATDTNTWSDQLYRIYGHEPQSFNASYERFLSHIHPDDRERITGIHQQAYASGEPYQMIERVVRPDGQVRFLSSNGQVIRDATGTPVRMRGTCIDITDRVLAEQERERSAARFRGLVESSPDVILVLDSEGRILQANGRANDLLGGDPVGHEFGEILPWPGAAGQGVTAAGLDGRSLQLDVTTAELSQVDDEGRVAAFLHDATPRLASEALAATLREAQVRRRQALEINDNVVQGLAAAAYSMNQGNVPACSAYLEQTLAAARRMMNDWLVPLDGEDLQPGDLVRAIPAALDEAPVQSDAPDPSPVDVAGPHRILIVDDFEDVRTLLRLELESLGLYEVVGEAADGEEAVRMASALQPHVVLLDLAMPLMDGLQALPLIREAVAGVRVIVLSGFDKRTMAPKVLAAGAARYVEKGLSMNLAEVIEGVLKTA